MRLVDGKRPDYPYELHDLLLVVAHPLVLALDEFFAEAFA